MHVYSFLRYVFCTPTHTHFLKPLIYLLDLQSMKPNLIFKADHFSPFRMSKQHVLNIDFSKVRIAYTYWLGFFCAGLGFLKKQKDQKKDTIF